MHIAFISLTIRVTAVTLVVSGAGMLQRSMAQNVPNPWPIVTPRSCAVAEASVKKRKAGFKLAFETPSGLNRYYHATDSLIEDDHFMLKKIGIALFAATF